VWNVSLLWMKDLSSCERWRDECHDQFMIKREINIQFVFLCF